MTWNGVTEVSQFQDLMLHQELASDDKLVSRYRHYVTFNGDHDFTQSVASAGTVSRSEDPTLQRKAAPDFWQTDNDDGAADHVGGVSHGSIDAERERTTRVHPQACEYTGHQDAQQEQREPHPPRPQCGAKLIQPILRLAQNQPVTS